MKKIFLILSISFIILLSVFLKIDSQSETLKEVPAIFLIIHSPFKYNVTMFENLEKKIKSYDKWIENVYWGRNSNFSKNNYLYKISDSEFELACPVIFQKNILDALKSFSMIIEGKLQKDNFQFQDIYFFKMLTRLQKFVSMLNSYIDQSNNIHLESVYSSLLFEDNRIFDDKLSSFLLLIVIKNDIDYKNIYKHIEDQVNLELIDHEKLEYSMISNNNEFSNSKVDRERLLNLFGLLPRLYINNSTSTSYNFSDSNFYKISLNNYFDNTNDNQRRRIKMLNYISMRKEFFQNSNQSFLSVLMEIEEQLIEIDERVKDINIHLNHKMLIEGLISKKNSNSLTAFIDRNLNRKDQYLLEEIVRKSEITFNDFHNQIINFSIHQIENLPSFLKDFFIKGNDIVEYFILKE